MKIKTIKTNEDGSANVEIEEMSEEELRLLLEAGLISILTDYTNKQNEIDKEYVTDAPIIPNFVSWNIIVSDKRGYIAGIEEDGCITFTSDITEAMRYEFQDALFLINQVKSCGGDLRIGEYLV